MKYLTNKHPEKLMIKKIQIKKTNKKQYSLFSILQDNNLNWSTRDLLIYWDLLIGLVAREFNNGQVDQGSIPTRVIPKTQKMVLDATLLNTQNYKVCIKGKVEQSMERSSALPYTSM